MVAAVASLLAVAVFTAGARSHWPLAQLPVTQGGQAPGLPTLNLTAFGGAADGQTDNAPAFAAALAQLELAGGGTLVVPRVNTTHESVYAAMPLQLRVSRLTLRLERGVRLAALCLACAHATDLLLTSGSTLSRLVRGGTPPSGGRVAPRKKKCRRMWAVS